MASLGDSARPLLTTNNNDDDDGDNDDVTAAADAEAQNRARRSTHSTSTTSGGAAVGNRIAPQDELVEDTRIKMSTRRKIAIGILILAVALIALAVVLGLTLASDSSAATLQNAVRTSNIFSHLDQLYLTAEPDALNSRSVRKNYNRSAEYIVQQLTAAGVCTPRTQSFVVPVHTELLPARLTQLAPRQIAYISGVDVQGMRYGGNGTYELTDRTVFVAGGAGCNLTDYAGMDPGQIAVAYEGQCDVVFKALAAEQAGAAALLQLNLQTSTTLKTTRVRYVDWKEGDPLVQIPVLSVSWAAGQSIVQQQDPVTLSLSYSAELTVDYTYNIICDTNPDATSDIVMIGAHLDSVPEGPGIDDNASGSATVLEIALQFHRLGFDKSTVNPVRYGWWGAEEIGLLGSRHYVRSLQAANQVGQLALYLNYDMLGAPNYTPNIHNGNMVNSNIPDDVRRASTVIQQQYEVYFNNEDLPFRYSGMTGGSDYLPFLEAGVPSGGVDTGASGIKTMDERAKYGGFANAQYDPCYHVSCDTPLNVSPEGLRQCSEAAAFVLQRLAFQPDLRAFLFSSPTNSEL